MSSVGNSSYVQRILSAIDEKLMQFNPVRDFFRHEKDPVPFLEAMDPIFALCFAHQGQGLWPDPNDLILDAQMADDFAENEVIRRTAAAKSKAGGGGGGVASMSDGSTAGELSKDEIAMIRLYDVICLFKAFSSQYVALNRHLLLLIFYLR